MPAFKIKYGDKENTIEVAKLVIENEDVFHMKNLYKMIHDWLQEEGWRDLYNAEPAAANPEIIYLERILGTGSKEHRIFWRCMRQPNNYYMYFLKIDFMTLNMKQTEVMHQGHKMKTDRGDVIITITASIILDYKNEWKNSNILKHFDRWFRKRVYKAQVEAYKVNLYKDVYRLQNTIKQYLKLKTIYEMPKSFHPPKGI